MIRFFSFCLVKKKPARRYYKDEPFQKQVGEKIRGFRLAKNMSIEALAIECELDYSQVSRMELGKVNFGMAYLKKIATVLGIEAKELMP
jgi:transcriptional regulator with XRE-family HTH domain